MQDSARSAMQDAGLGGTAARAARTSTGVVLVAVVTTLLSGAVPARAAAVRAAPVAIPLSAAPASSAGRMSAIVRDRVPQIDPNHVVVRFRPGYDIAKHAARAGAHVSRQVDGTDWTELSTPNRSAGHVRGVLAHDRAVAQIVPSYIRHATTIPNDPLWAARQSSYLSPLRLDRAWDLSKGAGVVVAVVDTGIDLGHPDLAGQIVAGRNVLVPGAPPADDNGHGTMVSGVIAARTNDAIGVVGIAPSAKIMPIKVLDSSGGGSDTDIAIGVNWARTHGARVINLSLGGAFDDPVLATAIHQAIAAGIVVVAAAGNDGAENVSYPAADAGVLAVSATDHTGGLAAFSSYGWRVDVAAPGYAITSTTRGSGYATESGTSFASPIVAGVAALIRSQHPTWTGAQVDDRIRSTARDLGAPGVDPAFGYGLVDPLGALGGPRAAPRPSPSVGADEPNDAPADATQLTLGTTHSAQIAPETDQDWYSIFIASAGWYVVQVPAGARSLDREMDPIVELYHSDASLAASQALSGGDLRFHASSPGDYLIRVRNMNASTSPYTITVLATGTPPRFAGSIGLDFGTGAQSVGIGDVNGDGRNDAVLAFGDSSAFPDTVVVLEQTPDRSLSVYAAFPTDPIAGGGLAVGDLDGDGKADVVVPASNAIDVFMHINPSTSGPTLTIPRSGTTNVAIGDVDGDGHNDIVAVGSFGVRVYWGPGFTTSTSVTAATTNPSVAVGNVTHHANSLLDVVTCCTRVYPQTGARVFGTRTTYAVTGGADVAVGDLNDDAAPDVATTVRSSTGAVARAVQNGSGGLVAASSLPVTADPQPVSVVDVDGDGLADVVVLHNSVGASGASVGWLRQTSAGVFAAEQMFPIDDFATGYDAKAMAVGDIDGDGAPDVISATSYGVSILLQNSANLPSLGNAWILASNPSVLATNVASTAPATITLGRDVTNAGPATVEMRDGSGHAVAATVSYDGTTHIVTVTPNAPLAKGQYSVHLHGLVDTSGETLTDAGISYTVGPPADETPPQTTLVSAPSGLRTTAAVSVSFTSNKPGSVFQCSLDNQPYDACTSPQHVTSASGNNAFRVFARDVAGNEDATPAVATWSFRPAVHGYWMLGRSGAIYPFGNALRFGTASTSGAVDLDIAPSGYGYWIVDSLGRVFASGDAHFYGNAPALAAGDSVTSISRTASGKGYWLFTAHGIVYPFGDARSYGDLRASHLNGTVVDSVRTSTGRGYYMVGADGGVFSFGDARFHGSTGGIHLTAPVRAIVPDPDGVGYWLVSVDGGVFAFDAPFRGSMGNVRLNRPIVGMVAFGSGYLMVAADGGIFDFASKPFYGSLGSHPPAVPVVSVAAFG
jgi:type VII secretion-associated serine protease mycosin